MSAAKLWRLRKLLLLMIFILSTCFILSIRRSHNHEGRDPHEKDQGYLKSGHRLVVVVPFRDRFDELIMFVPNLSKFLNNQGIEDYRIFIMNQSNRYRFNRASLANVGYLMAKNLSDYIAIHDVDLIPLNQNLSYSFPEHGPRHLASPGYHPQYNYSTYFGGILLISNQHYELVDGMSNRFFGWGLEDDEFYTRIKAAKLPISRPENLSSNRTNTFLHLHYNRKRDTFKTKEQRKSLRRREIKSGLSDTKYTIMSRNKLTLDNEFSCTVFNVELFCNVGLTPWCLNSYVRYPTATS